MTYMKVALKVYILMWEQYWCEQAGIYHASYLCLEIPPPPPATGVLFFRCILKEARDHKSSWTVYPDSSDNNTD